MKSMKDQLKDWQKKAPPPQPAKAPAPRPAEKRPPPARRKSDEELFLEAVEGVSRDAVLEKYDESPPPAAPRKSPEERKADDEALFERFVGPVKR